MRDGYGPRHGAYGPVGKLERQGTSGRPRRRCFGASVGVGESNGPELRGREYDIIPNRANIARKIPVLAAQFQRFHYASNAPYGGICSKGTSVTGKLA